MRYVGAPLVTNANMGPQKLRQYAALDDTGETLSGSTVSHIGLSAVAYHRETPSAVAMSLAGGFDDPAKIDRVMRLPLLLARAWRRRGPSTSRQPPAPRFLVRRKVW